MRITTIKEFRDNATSMFKSVEPVLVMRRGRVAGFYLPVQGDALPIELRKDLQIAIADIVKRSLEEKGLGEEDVLEDFEKHRSNRRRR